MQGVDGGCRGAFSGGLKVGRRLKGERHGCLTDEEEDDYNEKKRKKMEQWAAHRMSK